MSPFMNIFDKETITSNDRPFYTDTNSPLLGDSEWLSTRREMADT